MLETRNSRGEVGVYVPQDERPLAVNPRNTELNIFFNEPFNMLECEWNNAEIGSEEGCWEGNRCSDWPEWLAGRDEFRNRELNRCEREGKSGDRKWKLPDRGA